MNTRFLLILFLSLLLLPGCVVTPETYMGPMQDGIRLATDVYLPPDGDGKAIKSSATKNYVVNSNEGLDKFHDNRTIFGLIKPWADECKNVHHSSKNIAAKTGI